MAMEMLRFFRKRKPESVIMQQLGVNYNTFAALAQLVFDRGMVSKELERSGGRPKVIYRPTASGTRATMLYEELLAMMGAGP